MAPVMRELEGRGVSYRLYLTGQHKVTIVQLLDEFNIATRPHWLYSGPEVKSLGRVIPWALKTAREAARKIRESNGKTTRRDIYVVHGDTFSTLLGIYLARKFGGRIAHVESGLRSYNVFNPFPEELVRLAAMRLSDIAYAPGSWAARNLAGFPVDVIDTGENTLLDALRYALTAGLSTPAGDETHGGVLFSIHRFETLYSRRRTRLVLEFAEMLSERCNVVFVLHPSTEQRLSDLGYLDELKAIRNMTVLPRMTYLPFMRLAMHSRLVVTDGGSNQEELSYLRIPTILMRAATERQEGLEDNVCLGKFDRERMQRFALAAIEQPGDGNIDLPDVFPSAKIVEHFVSLSQERQ